MFHGIPQPYICHVDAQWYMKRGDMGQEGVWKGGPLKQIGFTHLPLYTLIVGHRGTGLKWTYPLLHLSNAW